MKPTSALLIIILLPFIASCGTAPGNADHEGNTTAPEYVRHSKIVLGSPSLTAGIPGSGSLKKSEIETWLADPRNHEPLDFALPLGLTDAKDLVFIPDDNSLTRAKIELGRQLFFDTRLSGILSGNSKEAGGFSCGVCHQPDQEYSAYIVMPEVGRNASVTFNRLFSRRQFWDGKASMLEDQPASPITNPFEMDTTPEDCVARIKAIDGYRIQFEMIFGKVTFENICRALACFQRALVTGPSPWDYHRVVKQLEGRDAETLSEEERLLFDEAIAGTKEQPMSDAALRGQQLFFSDRARCYLCHTGANLTDELYHNVGIGMDQPDPDLGRYKVTKDDDDRGAFKTPTLRNVARSSPYMHDGRFERLEQVVDWFDQGGYPNEHLAGEIEPLNLTADEKQDLLAFLESLTSPLPPVETGRLP